MSRLLSRQVEIRFRFAPARALIGALLLGALLIALPYGEFPAFATRQEGVLTRTVPDREPETPAEAAVRVLTYEVGPRDTWASVAETARATTRCLRVLNPGLALADGAIVRAPEPGAELAIYQPRGGETLRELADYWTAERAGAYLGLPGPGHDVTLAELMSANALGPGVMPAGVEVLVPVLGLDGYLEPATLATAAGERTIVADWSLPIIGRMSQRYGGPLGPHRGIDIAAPEGTPIVAPVDGVIVSSAHDAILGLNLRLVHIPAETLGEPAILETIYGHLGSVNEGVGVVIPGMGRAVRQGDIIGWVGMTGRTNGPHVHWECRVSGIPENPLRFVAEVGP